jgi:hypothetical protein
VSVRKNTHALDRSGAARRALLTGGAAGLAAVAGATLGGSAQPADAATSPSITDWINVVSDVTHPADPTGRNDSTQGIQEAIDIVSAQAAADGTPTGGVVYLPTGRYLVSGVVNGTASPLTVKTAAPIYIVGAGRQATQINYTGTGDCLRMYNPHVPTGGPDSITVWGGGVLDLTIDGTNAAAGTSGLHIGDMKRAHVDVTIQHFNGSGSIGLYLDNSLWWTENGLFDVEVIDCSNGVVFDVTGNTSSSEFDNCRYHFGIDLEALQNGVVLQHGAYIYHADMYIHGGIRSSSSPPPQGTTWAALTITGQIPSGHPGAGNKSFIERSKLSIELETGGSNGNYPQTINQGTQGNRINECTGILSFRLGPWEPSNIVPAQVVNQFTYYGIVDGDNNLNPGSNNGLAAICPVIYGEGNLSASGVFDGEQGDFFALTLSQNITIVPNTSGQETGDFGGPQRKTFILTQPTSGGPHAVTWPTNSPPTAANPTVIWPSDNPPLMPTAAGAAMWVELTTLDGKTWYGNSVPAIVSGQYLCPPTSYAPSNLDQLTPSGTVTTSYSALSSTQVTSVSTGSFTAPPSGSVMVTATLAAQLSMAGQLLGFALLHHNSSNVAGNTIQVDAQAANSQALYTLQFIVTGLTPGTSHNFDLAAGAPIGTVTVHAFGNTSDSVPNTRGAPVTITVQAI